MWNICTCAFVAWTSCRAVFTQDRFLQKNLSKYNDLYRVKIKFMVTSLLLNIYQRNFHTGRIEQVILFSSKVLWFEVQREQSILEKDDSGERHFCHITG